MRTNIIVCDGCDAAHKRTGMTHSRLRKHVRNAMGWVYVEGKDFCKECVEKGKHK